MKKMMFILLAGMLLLLAACSDDDSKTTSGTGSDDTISEEPNESEKADNQADDEKNADEDSQDNSSEDGETASDSGLKDFPEYDTLTDEFDADSFKPEIATDNPDKRVILYADDNGEEQYKSIFIKHDNRLKIISLDEERQIFSGQLD